MWTVYNGAGYFSRGIGFEQTDIPFAKHIPLYTAPPQQERQGLTQEDLIKTYEDEQQGRWGDHVRGLLAIEAKLKEKNSTTKNNIQISDNNG